MFVKKPTKAIEFTLFETQSFTQNATASEYAVGSKGPLTKHINLV